MRLAVVAPHPDDEAISCGGTMITWPGEVYCIFVKWYGPIRKKEAINSCKVLGAEPIFLESNSKLESILKNLNPDLVLTTSIEDTHPTHHKVAMLVRKVWKGKMWEYEGWTPLSKPDTAVWFNEAVMRKKVKAVSMHKSQCKNRPWGEAAKAFNRWRAIVMPSLLYGHGQKDKIKSKEKYCEAFKVFK